MKWIFAAAAATPLTLSPAFAQMAASPPSTGPATATAKMAGVDGADVGTVTFTQTPSGILHVVVEMTNLAPGSHGFHIHEAGACDAAGNFDSAGGHYAGGKEHGVMNPKGAHAGDFPNVHVGENGVLKAEFFTERLSLGDGGENPLMDADGSAVVLHADPDDYQSHPAGHAGSRIACGVIEQPS
jgi:Cu-Zn family superoxide dismutase